MPLYEYLCDACGHRFERIQKFSDPPVDACPTCGGVVQKLISSPAIQFKGSGWYVTDYAKGNGSPGSDEGGKEAASAASADKADKAEKTEKKGGETARETSAKPKDASPKGSAKAAASKS
jgi:putative FmdB family regulatory protein